MAFSFGRLHVQRSWLEIVRRTFSEAFFRDNCLGMSAQLAYYFFFALFPALLVMVAVASFFPVARLVDDTVRLFGDLVPPVVLSLVTDQLRKISEGHEGGLLTMGLLAALWTSSTAMTAISDTLNRAYGVEEGRPWWRVRLTAVLLTLGVALFILVSVAFVMVGPTAVEWLANWWYPGAALEWLWTVLRWPLVFALASVGIALIYYFAPDVEQEWIWLTPGSVFATTLWLGATLGFKYYVVTMGNFTETYGALGVAMILMLWFYLSGLVILIGAELNAEIEHAALTGKEPGEKVPGQHRRIGAVVRSWIRHRRAKGLQAPSADEVREVLDRTDRTPGGAPR
jgi:membrane protein